MRMAGGPVTGLDLDAFITPGHRVRGRGRPLRALLPFLVGDRHYAPLPRAPRPASSSPGWPPVTSTASARAAICAVAKSRRRRPSSTRLSSTTGNVSPRSSSVPAGGVQQVVSRFATWLDVDSDDARRRRRGLRALSGSAQARKRAGQGLEHLGRQGERLDVDALVVAVEHRQELLEAQPVREHPEAVGDRTPTAEEAPVGGTGAEERARSRRRGGSAAPCRRARAQSGVPIGDSLAGSSWAQRISTLSERSPMAWAITALHIGSSWPAGCGRRGRVRPCRG